MFYHTQTMIVKWIAVKWLAFIFLCGSIDCSNKEISTDSVGVCSTITSYIQSYQETYVGSYQRLIDKPCGIFGMRTCASSRTTYRLGYQTAYGIAYTTSHFCCEGWKPLDGVCAPLCVPQCSTNEKCVGYNECEVVYQTGLLNTQQHLANRPKRSENTDDKCNSGNSTTPCHWLLDLEEDEHILRCDDGKHINILNTEYKLTQNQDCRCHFKMDMINLNFEVKNIGCTLLNSSYKVVADQCNNLQSCNISSIVTSLGISQEDIRHSLVDLEFSCSSEEMPYMCEDYLLNDACIFATIVKPHVVFYQISIAGFNCIDSVEPNWPTNFNPLSFCDSRSAWAASSSGYNSQCSIDMFTPTLDIDFICEINTESGLTTTSNTPSNKSTTTTLPNAPAISTMRPMLTTTLDCPADIDKYTDSNNEPVSVNWPQLTAEVENRSEITCPPKRKSRFSVGRHEVQCKICDQSMRQKTGNCTFHVIIKGRCLAESTMSEMLNSYTWPETNANVTAESVERCSVYSENRISPRAYRLCMFNSSSYNAYWVSESDITSCGAYETPTINELFKTPVTENNVEDVAETLSNITKSSKGIDIEGVQNILSNIFNVESSSPKVTELVIDTISDIIDAVVPKNRFPANASSKILQNVDKQIARTLRETGKFKAVTRNLAAEGVAINNTQFINGIGFGLRRGDGGLSGTEINDPSENQDQGTSSIQLPIDALFANDNDTDTQVSFVAHNNDTLFQSEAKTENETILGPVISAVVLGKDVKGLESQVVVKIVPSSKNIGITMNTSRCVYWDFNLRAGVGDWAEDGCVLVEANSEGVTCHCNHLTNFAVLVDFSGQTEPGTLTFALDIISKIGCAFSIGALCLTLMIFILSSRLRISLQRKILIQFCISMLCLYLAFLLGIDSGTDAGCTAATFLLHYFVLTTVFWMGVEARHMYITLVSKSDRVGRKFMIKAGLFAWGAALIPVGVVLGVKWDAYQADGYCFIVPDYGLYFGLLLPVGLVVLHNVATFVFVAKKLLSSKLYVVKKDLAAGASPPDVKEIAQRMLNAFSVSMLLGITWIFGFLAIDEVRFAFQLIFCICNSFQGVMIFILFCLAQKDVRRLLGEKFRSKSSSKSRPTKKQKQLAMTPVKARKDAPVTSISDSTRVSGEIYSEDGDTVVTNLDNDTMTINTMDSSELSD